MTSREEYLKVAAICGTLGFSSCQQLLLHHANRMQPDLDYPDDGWQEDGEGWWDHEDLLYLHEDDSSESGEETSESETSTSLSSPSVASSGKMLPAPPLPFANPPPRDAFNLNRHFDLD